MNRKVSRGIFTIVATLGLIVMIGWFSDIPQLKTVIPGAVSMKFTTALAFFATGTGGIFLLSIKDDLFRSSIVSASTFTVFATMAALVVEQFAGAKFNIENIFVQETEAVLSVAPGVPSLATMIAFLIFVVIVWHQIFVGRANSSVRFIGGGLIGLVGLWGTIGYILSLPWMYYYIPGESTAMAIHTTLGFILLGVATFLAHKESCDL